MADPQKLKVFISWSGALSRGVALALRAWLPLIFDNIEPWASETDIEPGQRGLKEIEAEAGASFGLVVLTQENQHSPWLHYESGALSKQVTDGIESRVVPLLVDISGPSQVTGPIAQFQMKRLDRDGMKSVISSIAALANAAPDVALSRLDNWDDLEATIQTVTSEVADDEAELKRKPEEMLEELLTLVRVVRGEVAAQTPRPVYSPSATMYGGPLSESTIVELIMKVAAEQFFLSPHELKLVVTGTGYQKNYQVGVPTHFSPARMPELAEALRVRPVSKSRLIQRNQRAGASLFALRAMSTAPRLRLTVSASASGLYATVDAFRRTGIRITPRHSQAPDRRDRSPGGL